jgi:predicted AAA+ superfamily ATPase
MVHDDLAQFGNRSIDHRLLHGGLPPFFAADPLPERDFQEWLDAYWAKDIQELFRLERRHAFQRLFELLLASSGGIFEASRYARACEVSRQTVQNYVSVLEATFVLHVVRPFARRVSTEIVAAPKVYGFDTGFVAYYKGWNPLRSDDRGLLWEHLVLNEMHAARQTRDIGYWRDKQQHEVDFVLPARGSKAPIAIECKWRADDFDPSNLQIFRRHYASDENYVVVAERVRVPARRYGNVAVRFIGLGDVAAVSKPS